MKSKTLFTLIVYLSCYATSLAVQADESSWQLQADSESGDYQALLSCESPPAVNQFQKCELRLSDQSNQAIQPLSIHMDGGMPAHGHGLPTTPEVITTEEAGSFHIKGLKYNMPGRWLLGFLIEMEADEDKKSDKFIMEFTF